MDKLLIEAQMREWPFSLFINDRTLVAYLQEHRASYLDARTGTPVDWEERVRNYRKFYPDAVAYKVTDGTGRLCFGLRYGVEPSEYLAF